MTSTLITSPWVRMPLVVIVALAVQTTLLSDLRPFGAVADTMMLLAICAGLAAGPQTGAVCGFAIGLSYDLLLQTPFGLSALTYGATGFAAGFLWANASVAPWWLLMAIVAALSAASVVLYAVVGTVFGLEGVIGLHLTVVIVVVAVVNGLLGPAILRVQRWALHAEHT